MKRNRNGSTPTRTNLRRRLTSALAEAWIPFQGLRLAKMAYAALGGFRSPAVSFSARRLLVQLAFFIVFPIVEVLHLFFFFLDELLWPEYHQTPLPEPVFIIGNPRSGTTHLHRLMARDNERFFCFHTWHILFPAICHQKFLGRLGQIDNRLGRPFQKLVLMAESALLKSLDPMHKTGLFFPEEDEMLWAHAFASFIYLVWLFPYPGWEDLMRFDEALDETSRRRLMAFYRRCVKKRAFCSGGDRRLLSKNPGFTPKIESLRHSFPDARFIYMVRNPLETIGSMQSMARQLWNRTLGLEPDAELQRQIYDMARYYYEYPLARLAAWPEDRYFIARYDDLVERPKTLLASIYRHFAMTPSVRLLEVWTAAEREAGRYRSSHSYSLEGFAVCAERIHADLEPVCRRFGWIR